MRSLRQTETRMARKKSVATRSSKARSAKAPKAKPASPKRRGKLVAKAGTLTVTEVARLEDLRRELQQAAGRSPLRWNADPDEVQRSVAQLVLTLVEFIRKLLERQAARSPISRPKTSAVR